jgi:hypothetical protein
MKHVKRFGAFCLLLGMTAGAAKAAQVQYAGGTDKILQKGASGRLDTSSQSSLVFESAGNKIEIPYTQIDSYAFSEEVAHHLGVLPVIAVALVKKRERKHFLSIVYHNEGNETQVVIFEVPKQAPRVLLAILQARAPQGYKTPQPPASTLVGGRKR